MFAICLFEIYLWKQLHKKDGYIFTKVDSQGKLSWRD